MLILHPKSLQGKLDFKSFGERIQWHPCGVWRHGKGNQMNGNENGTKRTNPTNKRPSIKQQNGGPQNGL